MSSYIIAIDQGTTGTRSVLVNTQDLSFIDAEAKDYPQIYPGPGMVEHNLNEIWDTVKITITNLLRRNNVEKSQIKCIGVTNQRETICTFDRSGNPLYNAIVWQDRRTSEFCRKNKKYEKMIRKKTGLPLDPYFSASKIKWILENQKNLKSNLKNNNLLFGTIDTFLIYKLTGNRSHVTEASNASRTLLMDLKTLNWDKKLLDFFGVDLKSLPQIVDSMGNFGVTKGLDFLPDNIPICGVLGDQQSALFGQSAFKTGQMKCTYGTGAFMLMNTGDKIQFSKNGLLTTVFFATKREKKYAIEGSAYIAGAAVQWLRDNLNFFSKSSEVEELAKKITNKDELVNILFFPFFTGLASPYWVSDAKAAIIGLTRDSGAAHIANACLEGVAFSIADILISMSSDIGSRPKELRVDGGMVKNNYFLQTQANILKAKIIRPQIVETTAYGAACAAAIGSGIYSLSEISSLLKIDQVFTPDNRDNKYYTKKKILWDKTIKKMYL